MANFREYYIGHPDDDNFEETMDEILGEHDVNKLHDYLKVFDSDYHYPAFLDLCLNRRSLECALYIIQGNLPHGPPFLGCDHLEPRPRVPVLYHAIRCMCEPAVFHLLLYNCKAAKQVNRPYVGLLPLHWLLDLLTEIPPLSEWSPGKPVPELIASLFLPQVRPKLECARMLAQHTQSLDQVALGYILNGEVIALAALLLVAPFTKGDLETIKTYISSIASQPIDDQSVTPSPSAYCAAAALLYIFDKHGDKLTSSFTNEHEPDIQALSADVELTDIYRSSNSGHPDMLKSICERLGFKTDDTTQISRKSSFRSVESVKGRNREPVPAMKYPPTIELSEPVDIFSEGLGLLGLLGDEA